MAEDSEREIAERYLASRADAPTSSIVIQRRSTADSLEYIAARLEAAVDGGTEETLRKVAFQSVVGLRVLAAEVDRG